MKIAKKSLSLLLSIIMILSVFTIVPISASAESAEDTITVFFTDTQGWDSGNVIQVYYWETDESHNDWNTDGKMTYLYDNAMGQSVYGAKIPSNVTGIVFHQSSQTVDITDGFTDGAWWYAVGSSDSQGHAYVEKVNVDTHFNAVENDTSRSNIEYYKLDDNYYDADLNSITTPFYYLVSNYDQLTAAIAENENAPVIKLGADFTTDTSVEIAGKELTLDLNGHTLTGTVTKVLNITGESEVTIGDSVGGGKIYMELATAKTNASAIYVLNSDVTFNDGVTVDVTATQPSTGTYNNYALDLYYGANNSHQSVVTINDATFHSTVGNAVRQQGSGYKPGSALTINGGYFYSGTGMGLSLSTAAGCDGSVINGGKFYSSVGSTTPASKVAEGKYLLATGATDTGYCVLEVVDNLNDAIAYKELSGGQQYYVADCGDTGKILDIMNGTVAKIVFIKDTTWNADKVCGYTAGNINSTTGALSYWTPTYVIKDGAILSGSMPVQQAQITVVEEDGGVIDSGFFTPAETFEQVDAETVDETTTKYTYESTDYHIEDQNGNKYVTLNQAFGATYSAADQMTFTLLKDIETTEKATVKGSKGTTLDLNGHNIDLNLSSTGYGIAVSGSGTSTEHYTFTVTGQGSISARKGKAINLPTAYNDLVIDGKNDELTINCNGEGIYANAKDTQITINGGTINSYDGEYHSNLINAIDGNFTSKRTKIIVNGGKFFGYDPQRCPSEPQVDGKPANLLSEGLAAEWEGNYSTDGYFTVAEAVAVADGDNFASIANAVNKAPGKTITLLADIDEAYTLGVEETLNVDKNGHSITVNAPDGCALIESENEGVTTYTIHAHDWDTENIVWQWQDVESAVASINCKDADETQTLDATITSEVTTQPGCTETGIRTYTAAITFNGAEYTDTKEQEIPANGHSYGTPVWTWDLDAEPVTASAAFTCSACGDVQTVDADIAETVVDATLTEDGSVTYTATVTFNNTEYSESKTVTLKATAVAKVGEDYYASVQDAVDAAKAGDTVVIVEDHTLPASVKINKNLTIDLNGKTVEYGTVNNNAAFYAESGILKIKDSSDDKTGTIKVTKTATNLMAPPRGAWANTGATVRFESGNIDAPVGIYASAKSTVIVTGGNITAQRAAVVASGSKDETVAKAYISGGTLAGEEYGVQADGYSMVNISGGDISCNIGVGVTSGGSTLVIKGGNIDGVENGVKLDGKGVTKDATISGGKITAADGNDALNCYSDSFNLTVSGGEFSTVVPEKYCADGFEPVTTVNENGLYEVTRKMVAEVNGVQYTSVQAAVDAASAGDTVTLIGDEALQASVKIEKNLTIDLNGHTLTYKTVNNNGALYADGITLTVKDSSDPSTGLIKTVKEGDALMTPSGIWANNGATVNFESGNIDAPNGIHVGNNDSVANVSGGTITASKSALYVSGWSTKGNAHATVTGGTLNGGEYGVNLNGYCDVTISGGDISGDIGVGVTSGKSDLTITDGKISGTTYGVYLNNTGALVPGTKNVKISGGIISASDGDAIYSPTENFIIAVSGGSFSNPVPDEYCANGYEPKDADPDTGMYTVKRQELKYTYSIALEDEILIYYYVKNLPAGSNPADYTITYTFNGAGTTERLYDVNDNRFVIARCAAKEMNDNVSVVIKHGDEVIKEGEYSVKGYCDAKLDKNSNASDELKALCRSTLIYGAEAQKEFGYKTDNLPIEGYEAELSTTTIPNSFAPVRDVQCTSVEKVTYSLSLEYKTKLNFYFKPASGVSADKLTVTVDDVNIELGSAGDITLKMLADGRLSLSITGISAKELNKVFKICVSDGSTTSTYNYSALTYAYARQTKTLSRAIYGYHKSADVYFKHK